MNFTGILQWIQSSLPATPLREGLIHSHPHSHGDYIHTHAHGHDPEHHLHDPDRTPLHWLARHLGALGFYQLARPLVIGLVHGLAGSAAVALLVLPTIHDPRWATAYLFVFGVGTIAGMMLITAAISVPLSYAGRLSQWMDWSIRVASGVISLGFGVYVAYQISYISGLFAGHPQWTPH